MKKLNYQLLLAEQYNPDFWSENATRLRNYRSRDVYQHYIRHSSQWKNKRLQKLTETEGRCQCPNGCFAFGPLEIHHTTYRNLFDEPMDDLVVLCSLHHESAHGRSNDYMVPVRGMEYKNLERRHSRRHKAKSMA